MAVNKSFLGIRELFYCVEMLPFNTLHKQFASKLIARAVLTSLSSGLLSDHVKLIRHSLKTLKFSSFCGGFCMRVILKKFKRNLKPTNLMVFIYSIAVI